MRRTITFDQFKAELSAQGVDREHFAVRCVACGTVQSRQDFVNAGIHPTIEEAQKHWGFSCIGRWKPGKGCDWTLGGLLHIHTLEIDFGAEEFKLPCFEPASAAGAQANARGERVIEKPDSVPAAKEEVARG